jgi:hypothetical protein
VACGASATFLVTNDRRLLSFGTGALGHERPKPAAVGTAAVPAQVALPLPVFLVAAGPSHCLAITLPGDAYTWGAGANGRLGHGDSHSRPTPTALSLPNPCVGGSCGERHTVLLVSPTPNVYNDPALLDPSSPPSLLPPGHPYVPRRPAASRRSPLSLAHSPPPATPSAPTPAGSSACPRPPPT